MMKRAARFWSARRSARERSRAGAHPRRAGADQRANVGSTQPRSAGAFAWRRPRRFLNDEDAATVAAFTERLMPGAPGKPGARDAGVLNYIDLALAGAYADLQDFYRRGLAQLDAYCHKTHNAPFAQLNAAQQDEVITALEQGKATGFTWPTAQAFFNTLRTHTIEGMFADPVYGGNKDFAGWRLVGFPGRAADVHARRHAEPRGVHAGAHDRSAGASPDAEG